MFKYKVIIFYSTLQTNTIRNPTKNLPPSENLTKVEKRKQNKKDNRKQTQKNEKYNKNQ